MESFGSGGLGWGPERTHRGGRRTRKQTSHFRLGYDFGGGKDTVQVTVAWYKRLFPFLGPAFIAAVADIDPGNFATNIQGGAQLGYTLLWVIIVSNLMAMLVKSFRRSLASPRASSPNCAGTFPPLSGECGLYLKSLLSLLILPNSWGGGGLFLLFHIPLVYAGFLTAIITFLVLGLQRYGFRPFEAIISVMIGVVAGGYLIEIFLVKPEPTQILSSLLVPGFTNKEGVLLAAGILGATVMPHVIFLHSALTQGRIVVKDIEKLKLLFHYEVIDVAIAMTLAGAVNAAMLIMAAATFYTQGLHEIGTLDEAYRTLSPILGPASSYIFAIALIAAGLSSSAVGTMAGQVVMQGFIHSRIPLWIRRLVTVIPSLVVLSAGLDPTRTLVISQVVLSFGLPFAVIPLVLFTANKKIMGPLVNRPFTTFLAAVTAILIVALNVYLLYSLAA